jgi:uroporphyrinogen-III synthase
VILTLETMPAEGREVTVVHYGERNEPIVSNLEARGARVHELMLYEWRLPADVSALSQAIDALISGEIPVLAFTSQVQVRHLLEVAGPGRREALLDALNASVLVGAVGPTCAAACTSAGIRAVVSPERPKLSPLLQVLATAHTARGTRAIDRTVSHPKECP